MVRLRHVTASLALVGSVLVGLPAAPAAGGEVPTDVFHGVVPARLADTRAGQPTIDGRLAGTGEVGPGATATIDVLGRGGVPPSGVGAVALNVTVTEPTADTFLTVFPTGSIRPTAANLNASAGQTAGNMVLVPLGSGGRVSIFNFAGAAHVVVDVLGWFPAGEAFHGLVPARLWDTRTQLPTVDGRYSGTGALGPGETFALPVAGRGGVPATGAAAVAVNVAAVGPTTSTFITVYPSDASRPTAANLNARAGEIVPNMAIVPLGADGTISLFNYAGSTDLVVDVLGWFPATGTFPASPPLRGLVPSRLADTRPGFPTIDGLLRGVGAIAPSSTLDIPVLGRGGVPAAGVGSVALNVAVTEPTADTYLTVYPAGASRPTAANVNLVPGQTRSNMVIVPVGTGGMITIFNFGGQSHVVVDVLGWFPSATASPATELVSRPTSGTLATNPTVDLSISADGRYVAFSSASATLVPNDSNGTKDVFVRDRLTGTTRRVSTAADGAQLDASSLEPDISADGRYVTFRTQASNVIPGASTLAQIYVKDLVTGAVTWASRPREAGVPATSCYRPSVSGSGGRVAFECSGPLVSGDGNTYDDVYVADLEAESITWASRPVQRSAGNERSGRPRLSRDGSTVVFESAADNLLLIMVSGIDVDGFDSNGHTDVFARTLATGALQMVSVDDGGEQGNGDSTAPTVSADGRSVAFTTVANDLGPTADINGETDIMLRDLSAGTTRRVSVGAGGAELFATSEAAALADDARSVAFTTDAALHPADTNGLADVYVRDLVTGAITAVSIAVSGTAMAATGANTGLCAHCISSGGRWVGFRSDATGLVTDTVPSGQLHVYVRDVTGGS